MHPTTLHEDIIDELGITNTDSETVSVGTVVGEDVGTTQYADRLWVKGVPPFTNHYITVEIVLPRAYA